MENELDKIFRQGSENRVEPTFESDWQAFEKSMKAAPFYKSPWFLGALTLLIVSLSVFSVYTFSQSEEPISSSIDGALNGAQSEIATRLESDSAGNTEQNQSETLIVVKRNDFEESTTQGQKEIENSESIGANSKLSDDLKNVKEISESNGESAAIEKGVSKSDTGGAKGALTSGATSVPLSIYPASAKAKPQQVANTEGIITEDWQTTNSGSVEHGSVNSLEAIAGTNGKSENSDNSDRSNMTNPENLRNLKNTLNPTNPQSLVKDQAETQNVLNGSQIMVSSQAATSISSLKAWVGRDPIKFEISQNVDVIIPSRINAIRYAIFLGVEQNAVLKTSPSIGFIAQKRFSRWSIELGIAYKQNGRLNWTQRSDSSSFGFDRYENSIRLRTERVDMVSLPIKLSYRMGGHSQIFAGITPSIIVNARQEKLIYNDGTLISGSSETGYLYQTGAPDLMYFMSGGYSYTLSEHLQFDFGLNYSFQNWQVSDKKPFGGFVKCYFTLR